MITSIEEEVMAVLQGMATRGRYPTALVCTEDGLPVAVVGEDSRPEELAAFVSLFDTIVHRAQSDAGMEPIDEVSMLSRSGIRLVLRPILVGSVRFFLVLKVDRQSTWRRNSTRAVRQLTEILAHIV